MKNITLAHATHRKTRGIFQITQCTSYSGAQGQDCDTSAFHIGGVLLSDHGGTTSATEAGDLQCSAAAGGCDGVAVEGMEVVGSGGEVVGGYACENVVQPVGFVCDGE